MSAVTSDCVDRRQWPTMYPVYRARNHTQPVFPHNLDEELRDRRVFLVTSRSDVTSLPLPRHVTFPSFLREREIKILNLSRDFFKSLKDIHTEVM